MSTEWERVERNAPVLLGQHERTLDGKSRLAIPTEFRSALGGGAVLTRSFDDCLCIYPAERWQELVGAIGVGGLPDLRSEVRDLARALFGSAVRCEFDRQGRIVVPAFLREYAGFLTDIIVVGIHNGVELWAKEVWLRQQHKFEADGHQIAAALASGA